VFTVAVITLTTYFNPLRGLTGVSADVGDIIVRGSKITMEHPKLSGFTRDSRAYNITADSAAQDLARPDLIELSNIRAQVEMKDTSMVHMSALQGTYNSKSEILNLTHDIRLNTTNGYTGRLSEAIVDIKKGDVVSEKPVRLKMLQGTLDANRLTITESGDLIRFDRGVEMTLVLDKAQVDQALKANAARPATAGEAQ